MGSRMSIVQMDGAIARLRETCRVFAPRRGGKTVRYGEISSVSEIVLDAKSHFSPKEAFYPVVQTMFYFAGNECKESETSGKRIVVFARPCDIHSVKRLDAMFLENGGQEDAYYARLRNKLVFFMIECTQGWDNCFCVSMGTNKAEDYAAAFRFDGGGVTVDVKDSEFAPLFQAGEPRGFTPDYVRENKKKVTVPAIGDEDLPAVRALSIWDDIAKDCVSCGACNTVCGTCSCFDTADIIYNQTSREGERRRVYASCMQESFTAVAGGHKVRGSAAERMRFKTLHKIYGFKKRFGGGNMCVGCGRCDDRCPEDISFSDAVNKLNAALGKGGNT
jgi:anaerobic sulfite reductase subunit A